jgi:hypothetical protein
VGAILCRCPEVTRSGFYVWHRRTEPRHAQRDRQLRTLIRAAHAESGRRNRCTTDALQRRHDIVSGSIYGVGSGFQSCRINDLEMVAQICRRWNPLTSWLRQVDAIMRAA